MYIKIINMYVLRSEEIKYCILNVIVQRSFSFACPAKEKEVLLNDGI